MKKVNLFSMLIVAAVMMLGLTNCKKDLNDSTLKPKKYVDAVAASFNVVQNGLTFKSLPGNPVATQNVMSMYAKNSTFYGATLALIDGREFITGSPAYNFWHVTGNNPAPFGIGQIVYSNFTPDEDIRVIVESTNAGGTPYYIGINDLNPSTAQFPLDIKTFRLGDVLTINTDAITALPGTPLTITVSFNTAPVDINSTKGNALANNATLDFGDIIYDSNLSNHSIVVPANQGDFVLYNGVTDKVLSPITITISGAGNSPNVVATVLAKGAGHGLQMTLSTNKVGWFDSSNMNITQANLTIDLQDVPIN